MDNFCDDNASDKTKSEIFMDEDIEKNLVENDEAKKKVSSSRSDNVKQKSNESKSIVDIKLLFMRTMVISIVLFLLATGILTRIYVPLPPMLHKNCTHFENVTLTPLCLFNSTNSSD